MPSLGDAPMRLHPILGGTSISVANREPYPNVGVSQSPNDCLPLAFSCL